MKNYKLFLSVILGISFSIFFNFDENTVSASLCENNRCFVIFDWNDVDLECGYGPGSDSFCDMWDESTCFEATCGMF